MWVAKHYKYEDGLYLFNQLPIKVDDKDNALWHFHNSRHYREFDSMHGKIRIDEKFDSMFDGLEQPVEVNLVKCGPDEAMFYVQRHADRNGFEHLYIARTLTTHNWFSGRTTVDVDTYPGDRLPKSEFPELTAADGYIPVKIEIARRESINDTH